MSIKGHISPILKFYIINLKKKNLIPLTWLEDMIFKDLFPIPMKVL